MGASDTARRENWETTWRHRVIVARASPLLNQRLCESVGGEGDDLRMERASGGGAALPLITAGVGAGYAYRVLRQLRCRAINPDVQDPARNLMRWLQGLAIAVAALIVAVAVALFWSMGPVAIIFAVPLALLLVLLGLLGALYLWAYAEMERRKGGYVICEVHYPDAPRQVKASMRRIYRAARSVKSGVAYTSGVLGKVEMDRLVFAAAERAVVSSELSAAVRDLRPDASEEDRTTMENAANQIKEIVAHLGDVEKALKQSAVTAKSLSDRITEPARRQEAKRVGERQVAARNERRQRARSRLDDARLRAQGLSDIGLHDVTEQISAIDQGHQEASEISATVLTPEVRHSVASTNRDQITPPDPNAKAGLSREAALRAAASSAGKAGRLTSVAAKSGLKKLRHRNQER